MFEMKLTWFLKLRAVAFSEVATKQGYTHGENYLVTTLLYSIIQSD